MPSEVMTKFFQSEVDNYRQAIADGEFDPAETYPPTLAYAFDSFTQAPEDLKIKWMGITGTEGTEKIYEKTMAFWEEFTRLLIVDGSNNLLMDYLNQ